MSNLEDLWLAYKQDGQRDKRDELILHYRPLVAYVAGKLASGLPQNVDQSDLVSYGIFGLIDAIDKFDLERGYKFETYAVSRIKGAILDELRAMDWVPRSVRSRSRSLDKAHAELESQLGRSPSDEEWASELDMSVEQLRDAMSQTASGGMAALDETITDGEGGTMSFGDTRPSAIEGPGGAFEVEEMRQILANVITAMPEREKIVLTLYYYEGLTLAEIGQVLGVTESRVCQIHTKAVLQLRGGIARGFSS